MDVVEQTVIYHDVVNRELFSASWRIPTMAKFTELNPKPKYPVEGFNGVYFRQVGFDTLKGVVKRVEEIGELPEEEQERANDLMIMHINENIICGDDDEGFEDFASLESLAEVDVFYKADFIKTLFKAVRLRLGGDEGKA